jgi:L,D-transpeptidase YcbB
MADGARVPAAGQFAIILKPFWRTNGAAAGVGRSLLRPELQERGCRVLTGTPGLPDKRRGTIVARSFGMVSSVTVALAALFAGLSATATGFVTNAAAFDSNWVQFGPTGPGSKAGSAGFDREFIKEWEANPPPGFATLSKANIEPTKAAIRRYTAIVEQGGWAPVPEGQQLQGGMNDAAVRFLRARLAASGELDRGDTSSGYFDLDVEKAVKRFQATNGLTPTGIVDRRTIAALNVPAAARLKQLKTNLTRLQDLTSGLAKRHVVVNIPAAQIEAIEDGQVVSRHAGVVGKIDRQTPIVRSHITDLNFNPVWTLPPTVVSEDLIPRGRELQSKGENVLVKFGIDAYDATSGKKVDSEKINWSRVAPGTYTYRQQPGKENPMGFLRINFNSAHSVFMHDTPSEKLFGRNFRSASSGCIRVHNIQQFATWLLDGQKGWSLSRVEQMKENGERLDVRLARPVQLHMVYLTAWATEDGVVQFRRDLYKRDGVGTVAANY